MGFVEWLEKRQVRALGKGCARVMLIAGNVMKEKYGASAPSYAWLACKALCTRPHWKQVSDWDFVYTLTGERVTVLEGHSLLDVIHLVVGKEVKRATSHLDPMRRALLLLLAHEAADTYIRKR